MDVYSSSLMVQNVIYLVAVPTCARKKANVRVRWLDFFVYVPIVPASVTFRSEQEELHQANPLIYLVDLSCASMWHNTRM